MPEKSASAGKLLFFGEHILKNKEAKAKLEPIKRMLSDSYGGDGPVSGVEILKRSQIAMGEAAYRAAVAAAGKEQTNLTIGWEVLGISNEKAIEIFKEVKKEGFLTGREAKYGTANQKYDKKGNLIDHSDPLNKKSVEANEENNEDDDSIGNVFECGKCGYTLFVAKGRDFKFYGADFKCPECGADKDEFFSRNEEE